MDGGSTGVRPGRGDSRLVGWQLDGSEVGGGHYHGGFTRGSERHAGGWATSRSLLLTRCPADTLPPERLHTPPAACAPLEGNAGKDNTRKEVITTKLMTNASMRTIPTLKERDDALDPVL